MLKLMAVTIINNMSKPITFSPPDVEKAIILLRAKPDYFPGSAAWTVARELENKNSELATLKSLLTEWLDHDLPDGRACYIVESVENWVKNGYLPNHN